MEVFANMMTGIVMCPKCGAEVFFDENKVKSQVAHSCWNCGKVIAIPASIVIGKYRVVLQKDAKLYSKHISSSDDMNTVVGSVVQNPQTPSLWGIKNESNENWTYIKPDGIQVPVASGKSAAIAKGVKINFGQAVGEFE